MAGELGGAADRTLTYLTYGGIALGGVLVLTALGRSRNGQNPVPTGDPSQPRRDVVYVPTSNAYTYITSNSGNVDNSTAPTQVIDRPVVVEAPPPVSPPPVVIQPQTPPPPVVITPPTGPIERQTRPTDFVVRNVFQNSPKFRRNPTEAELAYWWGEYQRRGPQGTREWYDLPKFERSLQYWASVQ